MRQARQARRTAPAGRNCAGGDACLVGFARRTRAALLIGTALQASVLMVLAVPASAQPAANARPQGGVVSAGNATISTTPTNTIINQASQRAVVDWSSFNVGSKQTVTFQQPNSGAVALNRVDAAQPAQIAGRITANGQIVIENRAGVIFANGAQVNAQSLVVTASGITNQNFMAGNMKFDIPAKPDARVVNHGTITIQQAGLAALVAPNVVNSGVIHATLGHVVLAGASTHTVDLYGDQMLSVDVSSAVTQVPVGANGKKVTALVTNTGTILAPGGSIVLTAEAADGIISNLVQAGGRISADSVGAKTGTVRIAGIGGDIIIEGAVSAAGRSAGTTGGNIELNATGAVSVASSARINASGRAGGGTVAVGTTLARARGGPAVTGQATAQRVVIQPGATINASATASGHGGRVTVLSTQQTTMAGAIRARGGRRDGDGGTVEVSGSSGLSVTGSIDVGAAAGAPGTILFDPDNLIIADTGAGTGDLDGMLTGGTLLAATAGATLSTGYLDGLTGNIVLQGATSITVNDPVVNTALTSLALQAGTTTGGGTISVNAGISLSSTATLTLLTDVLNYTAGVLTAGVIEIAPYSSGLPMALGAGAPGALAVVVPSGGGFSTTTLRLGGTAGASGITPIAAAIDVVGGFDASGAGMLDLRSLGLIGQSAAGAAPLTVNTLIAVGGAISLLDPGNQVTAVGTLISGGALSLTTAGALTQTPAGTVLAAGDIALVAGSGGITVFDTIASTGGSVLLYGGAAGVTEFGGVSSAPGKRISVVGDTLNFDGVLNAGALGTVELAPASSSVDVSLGGGSAPFNLPNLAGIIAGTLRLGAWTAPGGGTTTTARSITVAGFDAAEVPTLELDTTGAITQAALAGSALVNVATLTGSANTAILQAPGNGIAGLGNFTSAGDLRISTDGALVVLGAAAAGGASLAGNTATLALSAGNAGTGDLAIGQLAAAGVLTGGTVVLSALGAIGEPNGAINANVLTAGTTGITSVALTGVNAVGTLGASTTAGNFALTTSGDLLVGGSIAAGAGGTISLLATGGNVALGQAGAGGLAGSLTAGVVTINAPAGAITEPNGSIIATTLSATAKGAVSLLSATNNFATLGTFAAGGDLGLADLAALTFSAPINGAGAVTLQSGGLLTVKGSIAAANDIVLQSLLPAGSIDVEAPLASTGGSVFVQGGTPGIKINAPVTSKPGGLISLVGDSLALAAAPTLSAGATGTIEFAPFSSGGTASLGSGGGGFVVPPLTGLTASVLRVGGATVPGTGTVAPLAGTVLIAASGFNAAGITDLELDAINAIIQAGPLTGVTRLSGQAGTTTGAGGTIALGNTLNSIGTLGNLSAIGSSATSGVITVAEAIGVPLTVQGTVAAGGAVSLSAGNVSIVSGAAVNAGTVALVSTNGISEDPAGRINANLLTGSANNTVTLSGTVNQISTLGSLATIAPVTLTDSVPLTVIGTVSAGPSLGVTISGGGGLTIASGGALSVPVGRLTLQSTGTIDGAAGSIAASVLVGPSAAAPAAEVKLNGSVFTLGNFVSNGDFVLVNHIPLTVAGTVLAGGTVTPPGPANTSLLSLTTTGSLAVGQTGTPGLLNAGTVALLAPGTISTPNGAINANLLIGPSAGMPVTVAAAATLTGAVASLGGFASAGDFRLTDSVPLNVIGTVAAGAANTLALTSTGTLAIGQPGTDGALSGGSVILAAAGSILEDSTAGSITAGVLSSPSAGLTTVALNGTNQIAVLGGFSAATSFALTDTEALTVLGAVAGGGNLVLDVTGGGGITLGNAGTAGVLTASSTGTVVLATTGAILVPDGSIVAGTVIGPAPGAAATTTTITGAFAQLGDFNAAGNLTIIDSLALTVIGTVTAGGTLLGSPADTATLSLTTAGSLTLGRVGVPAVLNGGTVVLSATGTIDGANGVIGANLLRGPTTGLTTVNLSNPGNTIAALGAFTTSGNFFVNDRGGLAVLGTIIAGGTSAVLNPLDTAGLTLAAGGILSLGNATTAGVLSAGTVALQGLAGITEPNGYVVANLLTGAAPASASSPLISLSGLNTIVAAASLVSTGDLTFNDTRAVTVNNFVAGFPGSMTISANGDITANGLADAGGAISLLSPGAVVATGVTAGLLSGATTGAVYSTSVLASIAGNVGALGAFSTSAGFTLDDGIGVAVVGGVTAGPAASLSIVSAGPIAIGQPASAGALSAGDVFLAGTAISEPNGSITASVLAATASTGVALTGAGNAVAAVSALTGGAGDAVLVDSTGVTLTGPFGGANTTLVTLAGGITQANGATIQATGAVALDAATGIALAGMIADPTGPVSLVARGGDITETVGTAHTGQVAAGSLSGSATGNVLLDATSGAGNVIPVLAGFSAGGGFTLADQAPVVVSGAVSGGTGVSISTPGAITQTSGNIVAGTGTVSLFGGGGINFAGGISGPIVLLQALGDVIETGGVLNAGTLTVVTETGAGVLDSGGNAVGTLASVITGSGGLNFADATPLTIAGAVTSSGSVSIQTGGDLVVAAAAFVGATTLDIGAPGNIAINGTLSANRMVIAATTLSPETNPADSVALGNGAVIITGSAGSFSGPLAFGKWPGSTDDRPGAYLFVNNFTQSGSSTVTDLSAAAPATLRVDTGGVAKFDLTAGLSARDTVLFLNVLGTGTVTGQVYVAGLYVNYPFGTGSSVGLTGSVGGKTGPLAAAASFIEPLASAKFRFNSCPIASVNCIVLAVEGVPADNPTDNIDIGTLRDDQDDLNLLLPNVSNRDY